MLETITNKNHTSLSANANLGGNENRESLFDDRKENENNYKLSLHTTTDVNPILKND